MYTFSKKGVYCIIIWAILIITHTDYIIFFVSDEPSVFDKHGFL